MNPQTMQVVLDSLLCADTQNRAVQFAREISTKMLGSTTAPDTLQPIFTRMNGYHPGWYLDAAVQDGNLRLPVADKSSTPKRQVLVKQMEEALAAVPKDEDHLELLLDTLERYGSGIAAADDISEYDHRKMIAAVAACVLEYLGEPKESENAFLLYTADFSGIQKFIYTVSTTNALKALRSRSFFLELAMEHYIDELLSACGLNRVNLLYSGGGHCYLLLPNTLEVRAAVTVWNQKFNDWLATHFGINLYLADGYTPCCANDLTNTPAADAPYKDMFRRVSAAVSRKKVNRYTIEQIRMLNSQKAASGERECQICGTQSRLQIDEDGRSVCRWCRLFETLSTQLLSNDLVVVHSESTGDFTLPGYETDVNISLCKQSKELPAQKYGRIIRVYGKNCISSDLPHSIRLFMGDYAAQQQMALLAQASEGITRIGVCRMDVDNLGQSFVSGFEQSDAPLQERQKYVTLMRTSAFSRQMSLFFKCYINQILTGKFENKSALEVTVVYAGGDDVFLVGAWTDVIEAALRIRNAFSRYTCGALTLSAGIGLFRENFPIRLAANQTAELEDEAKSLPGKDAISLFASESGHVYSWAAFDQQVLGEKLTLLKNFFGDSENGRGNTLLYAINDLLKEANACAGKSMPLARFAYLLGRLNPQQNTPAWEKFREFSNRMYQWALDAEQRHQLITAIQLYAYQTRKAREMNGRK